MKAYHFLIACLLTATCLSGAFAQEIIAHAGERFAVSTDAGVFPGASEASASFSIPALGLGGTQVRDHPTNSVFIQYFTIDTEGTYPLYTTLRIDKEIVYQARTEITILPARNTQSLASNAAVSTITRGAANGNALDLAIIIPAIPDMTLGTTFIMPVTIKGYGDYDISIPNLGFANYEAPSSVSVRGETTVPVLVHIHDDAAAGTYVIPVYVAGATSSARIRIIAYRDGAIWETLAIMGIVLIIIGLIILIVLRGRGDDMRPRPPKRPAKESKETDSGDKDSEDKLITYY